MTPDPQLVQRLRDAGTALQRTMAERDLLASERHEPIAIVGLGCRLPGGAVSPQAFWDLLREGKDAVAPMERRWAAVGAAPGDDVPRWAGLLDGSIDGFDAGFFGISAREARSLDPQQRLLLEVAWEALEDAGALPERGREGRAVGVFVGACSADYGHSVARQALGELDAYATTGSMLSVAAGRLAYTFGFNGPCLTIDTACSSSLVAIHLAVRSLRQRESELAVAGGVNMLLSPDTMAGLNRLQALSPDGRCRTFDAAANGFVRGEGCGLVVLKRLSAAQRDGDRIHAIIRGSAVNQDGRSTGLTAPNVLAQEALLRDALKDAKLDGQAITFVETHGTGTSLGDPIEVEALRSVLGAARADGSRCVLGAVKTNVGHLEGAAGVVGLIKTVLSLEHEQIPRNLNFRTLNPRIRLEGSALALASQPVPWPRSQAPRFAGISSFGISGTNAHLIVQEGPRPAEVKRVDRPQLFAVSAKSSAAAIARAQALATLQSPAADVAFTLATTPGPLEHRIAVVGRSCAELAAASESLVRSVPRARGSVAFVFSGQGSQVAGMGRELASSWPVFRATFDDVLSRFSAAGVPELREVMWSDDPRLGRTGFTQPAIFALEYSLAALWRSWGVEPALVAGHSIGEVVAACVAGVMSLETAVRLVAARAQLMESMPGQGAMASLSATEAEVRALIAGTPVEIAAVNAREQVVISGPEADVIAVCARPGVRSKRLATSHAFHSAQLDGVLGQFAAVLGGLTFQPPKVPMVSNVTGAMVGAEVATAEYWVKQVRGVVRFADDVLALAAAGAGTFLELGARPVLLGSVASALPEAVVIASLDGAADESGAMLRALGSHWSGGGSVAWKGVFPEGGSRVTLPPYAWQRERHWVSAAPTRTSDGEGVSHPLLGRRLTMAGETAVYETILGLDALPWLADHRVGGRAIVPGAAIVELARAAGADARGEGVEVLGLVIQAPIVVEAEAQRVQISVSRSGELTVHARAASAEARAPWTVHATATLQAASATTAPHELAQVRARCSEVIEAAELYSRFARSGLDYGGSFQGLRRLFVGEGEALAELEPRDPSGPGLDPAVLDTALQAVVGVRDASEALALPFEFGSFSLENPNVPAAWVHVREGGVDGVRVTLLGRAGEVVAEVRGLRLREVERAAARSSSFYRLDWQAAGRSGTSSEKKWGVVAEDSPFVEALGKALPGAVRGMEGEALVWVWERREGESIVAGAHRLSAEALASVQAVLARGGAARVCWVTRGADVDPALAAVWGLGRTVMLEHPELELRLIDVDDVASAVGELGASDGESQVRWRAAQRQVARFVRVESLSSSEFRPRGTILITGGLGALGLAVAKQLAEAGASHLVLVGRRGKQTPGIAAELARLEALARVTVVALDVSDRADLAAALQALPPDLPLRGVVHAAGVVDDGIALDLDAERMSRVLTPKLDGAWHLHELTADLPLDFFILFSSASGVLGAAGQANYAAANAALDALASLRHTQGLVATSLAWGPWAEGGMAARMSSVLQARLARLGLSAWSRSEGLTHFVGALSRREPQLSVLRLDL